jgi:hypothetical protein
VIIDNYSVSVQECVERARDVGSIPLQEFDEFVAKPAPRHSPRPEQGTPASIKSTSVESGLPWVTKGLQRIARLGTIGESWHESEAPPPNSEAMEGARKVLKTLASFGVEPAEIDPSADGGICIAFYGSKRRANIECFNTGEVFGATVAGDHMPTVWEVIDERSLADSIRNIYNFVRQ